MNEALQRWRADFARDPDAAFDRLVRGLVPLGAAGQLSLGEILDSIFEPGDAALDAAASGWLERRVLGPLPEDTSLRRWTFILEEFFRAIAAMELPQTGKILRDRHRSVRLWLHGLYESPDRDPEGAYLMALARMQDNQRFSSLWRGLILGEELAGRSYLGIGMLGFRKMPENGGGASSDVPEGLIQALVELADRSGTGKDKWKQVMRSLFAAYRRSESYWVSRLAPILPQGSSNARDWLTSLFPSGHRLSAGMESSVHRIRPVSIQTSLDWADRIGQHPEVCDTPGFLHFLDQHRFFAAATGNSEYISKTFNNIASTLIRVDPGRAPFAVDLMREVLNCASWDHQNWTTYARTLKEAGRDADAISVLWEARHRFPWDVFIRNELGLILRRTGDLQASLGIFREAVSQFPSDPVSRTGWGDTLWAMGRLSDAQTVYEQASADFPEDPVIARHLTALRDGRGRADVSGDPRFRSIAEMSVAERLGRAMVALWEAEHAQSSESRSSHCGQATELLAVSANEIPSELLVPFVETKGLVLFASEDPAGALKYFEEQARLYGRGNWVGIRLGLQRARILLGVAVDDEENAEFTGSQSARFALQVARVIQVLSRDQEESVVRDLLKTLYPRAVEFAARSQPAAGGSRSFKAGEEMLGAFLQRRWFRDAGIRSADDLEQSASLAAIVDCIKQSQADTFDAILNSVQELAA